MIPDLGSAAKPTRVANPLLTQKAPPEILEGYWHIFDQMADQPRSILEIRVSHSRPSGQSPHEGYSSAEYPNFPWDDYRVSRCFPILV